MNHAYQIKIQLNGYLLVALGKAGEKQSIKDVVTLLLPDEGLKSVNELLLRLVLAPTLRTG